MWYAIILYILIGLFCVALIERLVDEITSGERPPFIIVGSIIWPLLVVLVVLVTAYCWVAGLPMPWKSDRRD